MLVERGLQRRGLPPRVHGLMSYPGGRQEELEVAVVLFWPETVACFGNQGAASTIFFTDLTEVLRTDRQSVFSLSLFSRWWEKQLISECEG